MSVAYESILIDSLDLWEQGESVEAIAARFPEAAREIEPILATAGQLSQLSSQPYLAAKQASKEAFLAEAAALQAAPAPRFVPFGRTRQLLLSFASLAAILILATAALFVTSTSALPGDVLYGAKRFGESARLLLTGDADAIRDLSAGYQAERIREIEALLAEGRAAEVQFEGRIDELAVVRWVIAGLEVQLGSDTQVEGTPQVGEIARVSGHTANGRLRADTILILTGAPRPLPPEDDPAPILTVPTATPTPEPEATEAPGGVNVPLETMPAQEPDPTATAEPSPTPVPVTTPDDDASGEADDGGEESGNGGGESEEEPGDGDDNSGPGGGGGDDEPPDDDHEEGEETPEPDDTPEPDETPEPEETPDD